MIVCCDGLTGFPDAVAATRSEALVQTCVAHLIRASMRFIGLPALGGEEVTMSQEWTP